MADTNSVIMRVIAEDDASAVLNRIAAATDKNKNYADKLIKKLKEEAIARKHGNDALELHRAKLNGATEAQLKQIAAIQATNATLDTAIKAQDGYSAKLIQRLQEENIKRSQGADALDLYRARMAGATAAQIDQIKSLQAANAELAESTSNTAKAVSYSQQLIAKLKEEARARRLTAVELDVYKAKLAGASETQIAQIRALHGVIARNSDVTNQLGRSNRYATAMMGQMGHQIQDVAVQLQMGTSAGLVFAQQGSQIASLFGPVGAVVGALFATVGALGTYFVATRDAKEETANFEDITKSLADEMERVASLSIIQYANEVDEAYVAMKNAEAAAESQRAVMQKLQSTVGLSASAYRSAQGELAELEAKVTTARQTYNDLDAGLGQIQNRLNGVNGSTSETTTATDRHTRKLADQTAELYLSNRQLYERELMLDGVGKAERDALLAVWDANQQVIAQRAAEKAMMDQFNKDAEEERAKRERLAKAALDQALAYSLAIQAEMDAARQRGELEEQRKTEEFETNWQGLQASFKTKYDLMVDQYDAEQALLDEALARKKVSDEEYVAWKTALDARFLQASSAHAQQQASVILGSVQQQTSTLAGLFEESSGLAKAFYLVSQTMAAGQAIINGYQTASAVRLAWAELAAATANPSLVAVGEGHATASMAMGFATAGAIMGQTIGSFEGGGYIAEGPRAGGLDGRGGMAAIVHKGESIVDHRVAQPGQNVTVNFTIQANDTRGFDQLLESRRGQIVSLVTKALANRGKRL